MVNLDTPNKNMLDELAIDKDKAVFWLKKHYGGPKSYEKMRDRLLDDAKKKQKNCISDVVEYHSMNGNRWLVYECARWFPEARAVNTQPYFFCFYETLNSIGAFVPVTLGADGEGTLPAVIIFTSHFFYRMSERLNIGYRSPEMVRAFHEMIPTMLCQLKTKDNTLMIRLPGSIGWGIKRKGDGLVFEIRTFLTDTQLNGKQLRESEDLRTNAGKMYYEPIEIMQIRMERKMRNGEDMEADIRKMEDKLCAMGRKRTDVRKDMNLYMSVSTVLIRMGCADPYDRQIWLRMAKLNKDRMKRFSEEDDYQVDKFIELLDECARSVGIRKFDQQHAKKVLASEFKIKDNIIQQVYN